VLWSRLLADIRRGEAPTSRDELPLHLIAPAAILVITQLVDPASPVALLLLVPVLVAFALRALLRMPAEVFAVAVIVPLIAAIGGTGDLEAAFFLSTVMVLYTAWTLNSLTRSVVIVAVSTAVPWVVAEHVAPVGEIVWQPWTMAHVFTWLLGRTLRRQRLLIEELEAARRALATQAVAEERRRIARELHDLAGHTLAAVLLHVTGARHVLRRDPEEAERALLDAEAVGRAALDQIRATVAALRIEDEHGIDPALATAADILSLVEDYRRAGLDITVDVPTDLGMLDGPVGTALHRIAREALTNVARHAPANAVEIRLGIEARPERARLVVTDRPMTTGTRSGGEPESAGGFGIVGMAERARALGGELTAGPHGDGWRVEAVLPLRSLLVDRVGT
jgi:signal transduction histidine kinase